MRPLRYSINITLDGCCGHQAVSADEDLHRHAVENIVQADALLFGRVTYEMMEAAFRPPARVDETLLPSFRKSSGLRGGHRPGQGSRPRDDASLHPGSLLDDRSTRPM